MSRSTVETLGQARLDEIARELALIRSNLEPQSSAFHRRAPVDPLEVARSEYSSRRIRSEIFDAELFGEPAWDILLDLYISGMTGRRVTISDACIAACVPATTGLRHVSNPCKAGLLHRESDHTDGRRHFLRLTTAARIGLDKLFTAQNRSIR